MTVGRVALVLLGIPALCVGVLWLCYRFYVPEAAGPHSFRHMEFRTYGADGRRIEGTVTLPLGGAGAGGVSNGQAEVSTAGIPRSQVFVFVVPDRGLDRDWNSSGVHFRTGQRLARYWASHGVPVFRFDPRGTGSEGGRRRHFSLLNQAEDIASLLKYAEQPAQDQSVAPAASRAAWGSRAVIVAHGEGCVTTLLAVRRLGIRPRALALVGCGFEGTYLEAWGELIIQNMRDQGAGRGAVAAAEARLIQFLADPFPKEATSRPVVPGLTPEGVVAKGAEKNPDLAGFDRALEFLRSPQAEAWTREAAGFSFVSELRFALQAGIPVTLFLAEYDSEQSPRSRSAVKGGFGLVGRGPQVQELSRTNHFLKMRAHPPEGSLGRALARVTPFADLSPQFLSAILAAAR